MQAILMAGGKGTRLRPFTTILPKPLVPIGEISRCATGIVYKCIDKKNNRFVAIKSQINSNNALNEMEHLKSFKHPNIVSLFPLPVIWLSNAGISYRVRAGQPPILT